jgi:lipopolysaccharide export system protein LptA
MKKFGLIVIVLILLIGAATVLLLQPLQDPDKKTGFSQQNNDQLKAPDLVFYEVSISEIKLGQKLWKINASKAWLEKDVTVFLNADITFYKNTKATLTIKAPRANLNMASRDILVWQPQCRFLTSPNAELSAQSLSWTSRQQSLSATDYVLLKTKDQSLQSDSLIFADNDQKVLAEGNVLIRNKYGILKGTTCTYLLADDSILLSSGQAVLTDNTRISAETIEAGPGRFLAYPDVLFTYLKQNITGRADRAEYFTSDSKGLLSGKVKLTNGKSQIKSASLEITPGAIRSASPVQLLRSDYDLAGDSAEYNSARDTALLRGNCKLVHGNETMTGGWMFFSPELINISVNVSLKKEELRASADSAQYLPLTDKVVLSGSGQIWKGTDYLQSDEITVLLKTKKISTRQKVTDKVPAGKMPNGRSKVRISSEILFR